MSPRGLPNKASQGRLCQTGRSRGVYVRQGEAGFAGECAQNKKRHRSRCQTGEAWESVLIKARQGSLCQKKVRLGCPCQLTKGSGVYSKHLWVRECILSKERQGSVWRARHAKGVIASLQPQTLNNNKISPRSSHELCEGANHPTFLLPSFSFVTSYPNVNIAPPPSPKVDNESTVPERIETV